MGATPPPALVLNRIGKSFDGYPVLSGISLVVEPGEVVGIVGPSGSGKTTLLRIIAGLDREYDGQLSVLGSPAAQYYRDRRIALVLQRYSNFPWLTARGNVLEGLRRCAIPQSERRARADRQLASVGLADAANLHMSQLSGGMAQRVALSRALVQPELILCMDEPLSALDIGNRLALQDIIKSQLSAERKTAVIVSHDVEEALYLSDRVLLMPRGGPIEIFESVNRDQTGQRLKEDPRFQARRFLIEGRMGKGGSA
jgi:ABC-type nitrate/sulfonate/bicarbonate transport system ATPase subunit